MDEIDRDYLDELRAEAAEVRADLEQREQLDDDPAKAIEQHDAIMQATRTLLAPLVKSGPAIVHKSRDGARIRQADDAEPPPPFSDEQMDIVAAALAELRSEFAELVEDTVRQRTAVLEGKIDMLVSMLGGTKQIEASETIRKLRVGR